MQQLNFQNKTKEQEAIEFIREHEPPEGYAFADSGGKDSGLTRHLIILSKVKCVHYYEDTGIDPPELVKHIKVNHPETIFLKPPRYKGHRSFFGMIKAKGIPPYRGIRWC